MTWRGFLGFIVLLWTSMALLAEDPPRTSSDGRSPSREEPARNAKSEKKSPSPLEKMKLPANAILVLCEEAAETLRLLPKAVVLTPEKYQELLDQIEAARRPTRPEKPDLPGVCKLTLQVDGNEVRVRATFEFVTDRPRALVALGCQRAWPTAATLDDAGLPALEHSEDGWVIHVEKPGNHRLTMDLVQGLLIRGTRGTERGIDLGLPRAAITLLERLELPAPISEVRLGTRSLRPRASSGTTGVVGNIPLGPADRLDLTWKAATPGQNKGVPLLASRARIQARIDETHVFTEAELTMEVLREETSVWKILVPLSAQATLEKPTLTDERIQSISYPDQKNPEMTIRFKEPSAEPLRLTLQVRQPRLGGPVAIGPFPVLQALPQTGTIEVRAPNDLRLRYRLRPDVSQREVAQDPRLDQTVASFAYWNVAAPADASQPVTAPVTLEVDLVRGNVEARVLQTLRLQDSGTGDRVPWRVTTRIEATPYRTGVDRLEVQLPAGYHLDRDQGAQPTELVEEVHVEPETQIAHIRLAQRQLRPFQLTLTGTLPIASALEARANGADVAVELPRPLAWGVDRGPGLDRRSNFLDHGGQVSVIVPDGYEVQARAVGSEGPRRSPRELIWQTERIPQRAEWTWRRHRPDLPVDTLLDVDLGPRLARVQQRLHFTFASTPPAQIKLDVPLVLRDRVQILQGGKPVPGFDPSAGAMIIGLENVAEREGTLVLQYSIPLSGEQTDIPLVRLESATRGQTRVRIWSDSPVHLVPTVGRWEELPLDLVPERRNALPSLVALGGHDGSLRISRAEPTSTLTATAIERILIRTRRGAEREGTCQTRFFLPRLTARRLEIELPEPLERSMIEVLLEERQPLFQMIDEAGRESPVGRVVRIHVETELYQGPVILSITMPLPARVAPHLQWSLVQTLTPPILKHALLLGQVRWFLELPGRTLPIPFGSESVVEQQWRWSGWLLAPRPAFTSTQLDGWLSGRESEVANPTALPALVCSQANLQPLSFVEIHQQVWLLSCSLTALAAGWLLSAVVGRPGLLWGVVGVLALPLLLVAVVCPDLLPLILYGIQPGILIAALLLGFSWMARRRYERQLVFMPAFTRVKGGSSLGRAPTARPREPSTVDNPSRRGNSSVVELPPEANPT